MRPRPALIRLIAVLLLMQWGTAFGQCLRLAQGPAAAGLAVEICTADGIHRMVLPASDPGGDPGDDGGHGDHAAAAICPACQGPGAVALPVPGIAAAAPLLLAQAVDPPAPPAAPSLPTPPRSCQPRAPPTS